MSEVCSVLFFVLRKIDSNIIYTWIWWWNYTTR